MLLAVGDVITKDDLPGLVDEQRTLAAAFLSSPSKGISSRIIRKINVWFLRCSQFESDAALALTRSPEEHQVTIFQKNTR